MTVELVERVARVQAHLAHFTDAPEEDVLGALRVPVVRWEHARDVVVARFPDDANEAVRFSLAFRKTADDLGARKPALEEVEPIELPETEGEKVEFEDTLEPAQAKDEAPVSVVFRAPAVPVVKPSFILAEEAKAPAKPAPVIKRGGEAGETAELDVSTFRKGVMPFRAGPAQLPATAPRGPASDGDTLPASPAREASPAIPPRLSWQEHARLTAVLEAAPGRQADLLALAGLSCEVFTQEDHRWRNRLAGDPILRAQWQARYQHARGGR